MWLYTRQDRKLGSVLTIDRLDLSAEASVVAHYVTLAAAAGQEVVLEILVERATVEDLDTVIYCKEMAM